MTSSRQLRLALAGEISTVADGTVSLAFKNWGTGSVETSYAVADGATFTAPPLRLAAHHLTRALAYADELIFDYVERRHPVLILRGPGEFFCGITGKHDET